MTRPSLTPFPASPRTRRERRPRVPPGALRRLAALGYDLLLVLALWMLAGLPVVMLLDGVPEGVIAGNLYRSYLLAVAFGFFGGFWVHGGQTLGMRAWRLRVVDREGEGLRWRQAGARFFWGLALFGIGFLWIWVDRERRTLYDRLSGTRVVLTGPGDRGPVIGGKQPAA